MKKEKKNLFFFHPKKIPVSRFNNMEPAANFFSPLFNLLNFSHGINASSI
jgi:hypothetical protein